MELLFEKLTHRKTKHWEQGSAQLQQSIMNQISMILSTRNYYTIPEDKDPDVLSFGIPRLEDFESFNTDSIATLQAAIVKAIQTFEPRLIKPEVTIEKNNRLEDPISLTIAGSLYQEYEETPVAFKMTRPLSIAQ